MKVNGELTFKIRITIERNKVDIILPGFMLGYLFQNMKFLLGQKKEMSQIYEGDKLIPVTKVIAGPCFISDVKTKERDGYDAVQIAFIEKKKGRKPNKLKDIGKTGYFQYTREFRVSEKDNILEKIKKGQKIDVNIFEKGESVKVSATSKGKGFQGVVKRHGFKGGPASHGHKDQLRMPGSIGSLGPAHVFKGTRMAGRMGGESVSIAKAEIVGVNPEDNSLLLKGAVPGARNGLVLLSNVQEFKIAEKKEEQVEESKAQAETKTEKESASDSKTDKSDDKAAEKDSVEKKEDKKPEIKEKENAANDKKKEDENK